MKLQKVPKIQKYISGYITYVYVRKEKTFFCFISSFEKDLFLRWSLWSMDFLQTQPTWELSFYSMQKLSTLVVYSSFVMLSQHQSIWYTMEKTFFRKKTTTFKLGLRTVGLFTIIRFRKWKIWNGLKTLILIAVFIDIVVNWSWSITSKSIIENFVSFFNIESSLWVCSWLWEV